MKPFHIGLLFALSTGSLFAEYAIIGGQESGTNTYAATVTFSGQTIPLSGDPLPTLGQINSVAMNTSGYAIIGGQEGMGTTYAALVSPSGAATTLFPPPTVLISSVAINESGFAIIGGGDTGIAPPYASLISPSGGMTSLYGAIFPASGFIQSVDINNGGSAIIGGQDTVGAAPAWAAIVAPDGFTTLLSGAPLPSAGLGGIINSVSINDSGNAIIGGRDYSGTGPAFVALVNSVGFATLPTGSPIPTSGIINSVAINNSGNAIIGGRDLAAGSAYAALISPAGAVSPLTNPSLPANGEIKTVAINNSGAAIIGGQNIAQPYAALISPSGSETLLSLFTDNGIINSVAISESGAAIIGGEDLTNSRPYAALVAPSGILTLISSLPANGRILSVALSQITPTTIGPYTSIINTVLAASFSLENHIMIHHKKLRMRERKNDDEISLLADAKFGKEPLCQEEEYCEEQPTFTLWLEPFYDSVHQKKHKTTPTFTNQIAGIIAALDYRPFDELVFGGGFAYAYNYVHYSQNMGHAKINQEMAVLYSSFDSSSFFVNAAIWGGLYQLDNLRKSFASISSRADTDGWVLSPHLELSVPFHPQYWLTIEPFGMVDWVNEWQDKFTEKGSSGFNLNMKSIYASLLRSELGLRFYEVLQYNCGQLIFEQKASYVNQAPFNFNPINTAFVGSVSSFSVATGSNTVQNLVGTELHLSYIPTDFKYPYGSIDFQGEFGSSFQSYFAAVEIGKRF